MKHDMDKNRRKFFGLLAGAAALPLLGASKGEYLSRTQTPAIPQSIGGTFPLIGSNVGIGNTTPCARLDISGNLKLH